VIEQVRGDAARVVPELAELKEARLREETLRRGANPLLPIDVGFAHRRVVRGVLIDMPVPFTAPVAGPAAAVAPYFQLITSLLFTLSFSAPPQSVSIYILATKTIFIIMLLLLCI
jgi:hypothetical protein